ncbi:uncharacterized protein GIQ15_01717 [Arthroderma uncinatum]|uniref:uncharacterized protein n=1 Tax=Arthroderma uncinatum TaxID=74035 RepID=UPI00144AEE79|nr:uncharacterized protein GIQ15_01717 [Arthroderma uncinatum]KAF3492200.1 hypothetical protein GIQ15_01717 [Arthroderma uncinatum]
MVSKTGETASEDNITPLAPRPTREDTRPENVPPRPEPMRPIRPLSRYTITPKDFKDLIEDLICSRRNPMTVKTSAPPAADSVMASAPAPAAVANNASTVAAKPASETTGFPSLTMSAPLPTKVLPSIEAMEANVVKRSESNASSDGDVSSITPPDTARTAPTPFSATISSGLSKPACTTAPPSAPSTAAPLSTHPGAIAFEYIRKHALPTSQQPELPSTPTTSQAPQMVFGQSTMPCGPAAPSTTKCSFASPADSSSPSYSHRPTVTNPQLSQPGFTGVAATPSPGQGAMVPRGFPSFANSVPIQTGEMTYDLQGISAPASYGQLSDPASNAISPQIKVLGDIDISNLKPGDAVFYFGVICVQEHLAPSLEFCEYFDNTWVAKLKFTGHEISIMQGYNTKAAAAANACGGGLEILKEAMPLWALPNTPGLGVQSNMLRWDVLWNYNFLLIVYTEQQGIDHPVYTQYSNFDGYRYEVEVAGHTFFGIEKQYPTIEEARIGCAHQALHFLILSGGDFMDSANPGSGFLLKPETPTPMSTGLVTKQGQSKFPFVPAGGNVTPSERRRRNQKFYNAALQRQSKVDSGSKLQQLPKARCVPLPAARTTRANTVKLKAAPSTQDCIPPAKPATPAFFDPSLGSHESPANFDIPDAAEFSRAIFYKCRIKNTDPKPELCTASICDRLSIRPPILRSKAVNMGQKPVIHEIDAYFYLDVGLKEFKGIGFASSENRQQADALCRRNTVAFLMEVMMGVNRLKGGNWIEDAAMQDKTGFYL